MIPINLDKLVHLHRLRKERFFFPLYCTAIRIETLLTSWDSMYYAKLPKHVMLVSLKKTLQKYKISAHFNSKQQTRNEQLKIFFYFIVTQIDLKKGLILIKRYRNWIHCFSLAWLDFRETMCKETTRKYWIGCLLKFCSCLR